MSDSETQKLLSYVQSSTELVKRKNVGYHIVFKEGVSISSFTVSVNNFLGFSSKIIF